MGKQYWKLLFPFKRLKRNTHNFEIIWINHLPTLQVQTEPSVPKGNVQLVKGCPINLSSVTDPIYLSSIPLGEYCKEIERERKRASVSLCTKAIRMLVKETRWGVVPSFINYLSTYYSWILSVSTAVVDGEMYTKLARGGGNSLIDCNFDSNYLFGIMVGVTPVSATWRERCFTNDRCKSDL